MLVTVDRRRTLRGVDGRAADKVTSIKRMFHTQFSCVRQLISRKDKAVMDSVEQQLKELMSIDADTELRFDDGILPANSTVLSFFSSVLRAAIESHSAGGTKSSSSSTIVIPMQGLTVQQWLAVAPFWHPVEPAAVVKTWAQAELLLRVGSWFDLRPVMPKAVKFLAANVGKLTAPSKPSGAASGSSSDSNDASVWKWLLLADELHLTTCIPALVKRAVLVDRAGCSELAIIQGLSTGTMQKLVAELAVIPLGLQVQMKCNILGAADVSISHTVCTHCEGCHSVCIQR